MFLAVTDSGLGGLSVCAALEREARTAIPPVPLRLWYVNAWPEEDRGYNDYPDMAARAEVFDRVLSTIAAAHPDRILIACNTLSILYPMTRFAAAPLCPVSGIIDAGVTLFRDALETDRHASLVLLGTRTTIASGVHRDRLLAAGIEASRVEAVSCHGLATAIERDVGGPRVRDLVEACAAEVAAASPRGARVFAGLCCTHYGYIADRLCAALASALARPVSALDPNLGMVKDVASALLAPAPMETPGIPAVDVVSKVVLDESTRMGVGGLVQPVSPATAQALWTYRHEPALF